MKCNLQVSSEILHIPAWMPPAVNPMPGRTVAVAKPGAAKKIAPVVPAIAQVARRGFSDPHLAAWYISAISNKKIFGT